VKAVGDGYPAGAETAYHRAIEIAEHQGALLLSLRAATALAVFLHPLIRNRAAIVLTVGMNGRSLSIRPSARSGRSARMTASARLRRPLGHLLDIEQ